MYDSPIFMNYRDAKILSNYNEYNANTKIKMRILKKLHFYFMNSEIINKK